MYREKGKSFKFFHTFVVFHFPPNGSHLMIPEESSKRNLVAFSPLKIPIFLESIRAYFQGGNLLLVWGTLLGGWAPTYRK